MDNDNSVEIQKCPFTFSPAINASSTLILEIIFPTNTKDTEDTSDSSSAQSSDKAENDEEADEEEDEDDDSCKEDSDNEYAEESEDDSSEGNSEASEDENNDEDSSDDEYGDELVVEFGNNEDELLIEFGNNGADENELVVEFEEDLETEKPLPPPHHKTEPSKSMPFWFAHEEPDQIRIIFDSYATAMDLEAQRNACIRSPAPFIGRIRRTQVDDGAFTTLDEVEIYLREIYPLGTILPLSRVVWVLTSWDPEEGVPTNFVKLQKSAKKSWQKRAKGPSSFLYCNPVFRTKEDFKYDVSPLDHSLMYSSDSPTNASVSRFSPYLPERCRVISFSLD